MTVAVEDDYKPMSQPSMSGEDFLRFGRHIESACGIRMPPSKKTMLEARLRKRLRDLEMDSFSEYADYVFGPEGWAREREKMIDAATTNKTDFFREASHFDFLSQMVLPEFVRAHKRKIRLWSAGCSSGEEPYTLAMVLSEFDEAGKGSSFSILATDISTRALEAGRLGVYDMERAAPIPTELKKKYLLKSKDKQKNLVRIAPELRYLVEFRKLNLMDRDFGLECAMDVIFCRNVIIYFERPIQQKLFNSFWRCLNPGGYIFLGHSETLNGLDVPLEMVAPTIYKKK